VPRVEVAPHQADDRVDMLISRVSTARTVNFIYAGKIRVVEVHAVGISTAGKPVMRGYQVAGLASRPLPSWSLFEIDKIEALTFGREVSEAPREGYREDDSAMKTVLCQIRR
jgi:hypothetical protein